jgi:ketosteroid isomerase-like protein
MHDPKLGPDQKAAFLKAIQQLSLEQSAEESVNVNPETESTARQNCPSCGTANRKENNFCASCGATLLKSPRQSEVVTPTPKTIHASEPSGDHHYHHHYHHHYFSGDGVDFGGSSDMRVGSGAVGRDVVRVRAPLGGPSVSRAEAALRKTTQDWALACNTKQLDDLVELYVPDALVQRPNVPAVRGTAAIREFFFGVLEAGMSEVELDPQRTELLGDFGYEAGRCKSLVPIAMGKRREERGKYLILLSRQPNGEWRIVADSWSSDLSLGASSEAPAKPNLPLGAPVPAPPRK